MMFLPAWLTNLFGGGSSGSSGSGSSGSGTVNSGATPGFYDILGAYNLLASSAKTLWGLDIGSPGSGILGSLGSSGNSDSDVSSTDFYDYFDGLVTNQGLENALNRQYNSAEAALNRQFQAEQAQIERDWYESMSSSAYQRAVKDMKAAGINPIMAYAQGGAASAGTGIPAGSAGGYTATGGDTISSLLSSMADVISSLTGASASKVDSAWKIFKMVLQR